MKLEIKEENNRLTAFPIGRLDTVAASQFAQDMQPLLEQADREIVIDCTGLEYISSSGLRQFLLLRKEVDNKGGKLAICHINDELRNIFTITGFMSLFDVRP